MKKYLNIILALSIFFVSISAVNADRSEKANVIKFDSDKNDLIIQRQDGLKWLIQHNRQCSSMSTEFPVTLISNDEGISSLKVGFNEMCTVYHSAPYNGEAMITKLIKSSNLIIPDHEGEIVVGNKKYSIDYEGGQCRYLYDYVNKRTYLHWIDQARGKGEIIFPSGRGQCPFVLTERMGEVEVDNSDAPSALEDLQYQAQNNQVYFYWDKSEEEVIYVISYSRNQLDLDDYNSWREMPNIRITRNNSYTVRRLANGQNYYFYIAAMKRGSRYVGPWSEATAAPVKPVRTYNLDSDNEKFQVQMEEKDDMYLLSWPEKEDARRYFIRLYIDGKPSFFRIIKTDQTEWEIPKDKAYEGHGLRFTVRSIPAKPHFPRHKDGIYWKIPVAE